MMAKRRLLSKEELDLKAEIWQFVLEHSDFFCDPKPDGLGFPRPGMIPGHYLDRPDEWQLDRLRVLTLKRQRQVREEAVSASTASFGMAPETRRLLDSIRRLDADGHSAEAIAAELQVSVAGVRNVLTLGLQAYDPKACGPTQMPELVSFRERWGRKEPARGGHTNGNGNGHKKGAV